MAVKTENESMSGKHLYLRVLRGDESFTRLIPIFYDISRPYTPFVSETKHLSLSPLDAENPMKVGCVPETLLAGLRRTTPLIFDVKKLEYSKVREAYEKARKAGNSNVLGKVLCAGGLVGLVSSGFMSGSDMGADLFLGVPSAMAFTLGGLSLIGLFDDKFLSGLDEFAKLNESAINADSCLNGISSKYLHPNLQRDDYLEFF